MTFTSPSKTFAAGLRATPRWALVALTASACVGLRAALQPVLGDEMPFAVAYPAVALAASLWGISAGLVVAAAAIVVAVMPWIPPTIAVADQPRHVGSFAVVAIFMCLVCNLRARRADTAPDAAAAADTPLTSWLRAVLWGSMLIPLTAFLAAAWWGYENASAEAVATARRASVLVRDHARHTLDVAAALAHRADESASFSDDQVRANEHDIHVRLADMVAGVPSIVNLNIWDADGQALVRSDRYPASAGTQSIADRAYFIAQKPPGARLGVSEVLRGRQTGRELMNVSIRRTSPDGHFRGVVAVSLSPGYFRDYFRSLAIDTPKLARFALVRNDGAVLAAWPEEPAGARLPPTDEVLARVDGGETAGDVVLRSQRDGDVRFATFQRVGPYPLYVVAGVGRRAMFASWLHYVGLLAALLLPVTAGLAWVSLVAIRKTRREQAITAQLGDALQRRAAAERAMLESQKLETLAQLTGGVAHDFNNLLAIVSSSLHVHRHLHPQLADERHLLAMERAVQSGTRLTRQLLSFSRRQALRPEVVDLREWLPGTEGLLRSTLGSRIEMEIAVEPDTRPVRVDLAELELSLINLALNAKHAMPAGGLLRIGARNEPATEGEPARVAIAVVDTGVGIPADVLPRVFEPFFTTRMHEAGSGLGLSQVHGFCAQAGGRVRIASTVGVGTTVEMLLPAQAPAEPAPGAADAPAPHAVAGRVLLVEDNEDVAVSTAAILQAAGLEVTHMWSADTALAALQGGAALPDLVLSDIEMPGRLNGMDLAFRLREGWPALPVILVTGYAKQLDAAVAGGLRVLPKPVPPAELLRELHAAMAAARAGLARALAAGSAAAGR
jgi:two-component system NtrC family sensor kinase